MSETQRVVEEQQKEILLRIRVLENETSSTSNQMESASQPVEPQHSAPEQSTEVALYPPTLYEVMNRTHEVTPVPNWRDWAQTVQTNREQRRHVTFGEAVIIGHRFQSSSRIST